MRKGLRVIEITEKDKHELGELGCEAVEAIHEFLECLDEVTDGQISEDMAERYGERRGVPGSGRRRRRYDRRMGERQGVAGTGRYGRKEPAAIEDPAIEEAVEKAIAKHMGQRMGERYGEHYPEDEIYHERVGYYGNRYDY